MSISALFFAHYQDIVGARQAQLKLPPGATVADLVQTLQQRHPRLSDMLDYGKVSVNCEFGEPDTVLNNGDEVAFLPPMSGG